MGGLSRQKLRDALDEHGSLCVVVLPVDVDASTYEGDTLPPSPVGTKRVAGNIFNMVTPLDVGRSRLTINLHANPFFIPSRMAGFEDRQSTARAVSDIHTRSSIDMERKGMV